MKQRQGFLRICIALLLCSALLLTGCPAPDPNGGTTTPSGTTPPAGNPNKPTPTVYNNPTPLAGTGDALAEGSAVLLAPAYSLDGATEKTAAAIRNMFRDGASFSGVYKITGDAPLKFAAATAKNYDLGGTVFVSEAGFLFEDCKDFSLSNVTLVGPVVMTGCERISFENVKIAADGATALSVDAASRALSFKSCRIEGATAVENGADDLCLLDSFLGFTKNGFLDLSRDGLYIRNCRFAGTAGSAIKTASANAEIRKSSITLPPESTAIEIGETKNVLVAECKITDAQTAVSMTGADNSVVVRNTLISVRAASAKHIYICDNAVGGKLAVSDINYILADGNTYPADDYDHTTEQNGITNANGNSLMDVSENAYLAAGANEDLLPHVDRDQFLGEERKTVVRDPDGEMEFGKYIMKHALTDDVVIIAPGAYATYNTVELGSAHKNTKIYAYGAFAERAAKSPTGSSGYKPLDPHFELIEAENVTVKGGTYGFEYHGNAQGHVIELLGKNKVLVKAAAGFPDAIGLADPDRFDYTTYGFRQQNGYEYNDIHHSAAVLQADGTIIMTFPENSYNQIQVGDVLSFAPTGLGSAPVLTQKSKDIVYQDMTMFPTMIAVCFHEYWNENSVIYNRVADTYRAGMVITEEEYNEYKALEAAMHEKGYADFTTEVFYDDAHKCYRGPAFRNASKDGVHVVGSREGAQILSSLFERLGDDGTNQFAAGGGRLSALRDNGDGTADIILKGGISWYWYTYGTTPSSRWGHLVDKQRMKVGDPILLYTAGGNLVLAGTVIEDEEDAHKLHNDPELVAEGGNPYLETHHLKVSYTAFHEDVLAEYLPYLDEYTDDKNAILPSHYNSYHSEYKVYIHNGGYGCEGARVENTKVDAVRSRAALLRAPNSVIKNCTYLHVGGPAIGISFETTYEESSIVRNMEVINNRIEHAGYRKPDKATEAAILIDAPGNLDIAKTALFNNLVIRDNVFRNRGSIYAIYVDGVDGITIEGNDLGREKDMDIPTYKMAIYIQNSLNIKIENNIYPDKMMSSAKSAITLQNIKGLTGKDVNDGDMFPEFQ